MKLTYILNFTLLLTGLFAHADLQVFPTRITLSEKDKTAQVSLRHKGTKPMRYRVEAVYYKMHPNGAMEKIEDAKKGENTAVDYFRFSPRQVDLQPDVEQVVRILLRTPANLADGDYYAHLYFEGMDEPDQKIPDATANGAQMFLKARMAVAVPVVVSKGSVPYEVSLENLKVKEVADSNMTYAFDLIKKGKGFFFGDFFINFTPHGSTKTELVGQVNGVSSYVDRRFVSYPLTVSKLENGTLTIEARAPVSEGGKVLATSSLELKKSGDQPKAVSQLESGTPIIENKVPITEDEKVLARSTSEIKKPAEQPKNISLLDNEIPMIENKTPISEGDRPKAVSQ